MPRRLLTLPDILEQHLEEAVMLSARRMGSVRSSLHSLVFLAQLDRRIEAHLDGLQVDAENSLALCEGMLKFDDAGEIFVGAQLALASGDHGRFSRILDIACAAPEVLPGLIAALSWSPYERVVTHVKILSTGELAEQRYVAVAARAAHRINGEWVQSALFDASPLVRARACRAAGELGRVDLVAHLRPLFQADDNGVAFWSRWSAALLGDIPAAVSLKQFVTVPAYAERALAVVLRRLPGYATGPWLEELSQDENNVRLVMQGAGITGDSSYVPGLIGMMSIQDLARVAAESFAAITGADFVTESLEAVAPTLANEEQEPLDDPDEFLPWPDVPRVMAWWEKNETRFEPGTRYLLGMPNTVDQLQWALRYGNQKIRHGAAIELVAANPGQPLFETRAPARRQLQLLGLG